MSAGQLEIELATGDTRRSNSLREPLPGPHPLGLEGLPRTLGRDLDGPLTGPFVATPTPAAEDFLSFLGV